MAARMAPLAVPLGSSWSDFEGLPPAVGVCVLDFGEALVLTSYEKIRKNNSLAS